MKLAMASGCRTDQSAYLAWRAGATTRRQSRLPTLVRDCENTATEETNYFYWGENVEDEWKHPSSDGQHQGAKWGAGAL